MSFEQLLDSAIDVLRRRQRITYGALKRQLEIDDATLQDLKDELILGQRVARDEGGTVLVWAGSAEAPTPAQPAAPAAAIAAPAPAATHAEAERRQLTILFCDLADSTALSNELDVEDMRAVLRTFQDCAAAVFKRHDGFVNSFLGDGIVAFFGYPKAQEDDARRAVRAGLDLVASVAALPSQAGHRLRVRVGIATGVVVVGDVIGQGASREEAVVGSTSNLAARLQSAGSPGEVVIAGSTYRLVALRFECDDLGAQSLKGFSTPVQAYRVRVERSLHNVAELAQERHSHTPLVGREMELAVLQEAWRKAGAGHPRLVTLQGEAGLGKSRLSEALCEHVAHQPHLLLRYFCSAHFQSTALYPVARQMFHAAGIGENDSDEQRLAKLSSLLALSLSEEERAHDLPYIAAMLGVNTLGRHAPVVDGPERLRDLTLRALRRQVLQLAREHPVLIVFEDLHWADPTTLALLHLFTQETQGARVMVLSTSRPGLEFPWSESEAAVLVPLTPLKRHHRAAIVGELTHGKTLPPEIVEHILNKSDGNPLFVEELTKNLIESGLLRDEGERYVLTGPLPAQTVPSTLQDSLLARLDRLGAAKEVAQAGAALGREFGYRMLASVMKAVQDLNLALAQLLEAELLIGRGVPPAATYSFKHALIQDAAYATMLRGKRQALHARIAEILEADPHALKEAPELLAHHYTEAAQPAKAIPFLLQAGLRASAAAAAQEACVHFYEGLRLVEQLPDEALRNRLEIPLRLHLGLTLSATQGFASPEVEATQKRARELCQKGGNAEELFWVQRALAAVAIVRLDLVGAREITENCVQLAQQLGRPECLVEGLLIDGYAQGFSGEYRRASEELARVIDLYRNTEAGRFPYPTPQDPLMAALAFQMVLCFVQGDIATAQTHYEDLQRTIAVQKRPFDQAFAQTWLCLLETQRGRPQAALPHGAQAIEISQRHGYPTWLATGAMNLGVAQAQLGAATEATALIGQTIPAWQAAGADLNVAWFLGGLALAQHTLGQGDEALATMDRSLEHARSHEEMWLAAELLRQRAALRLALRQDRAGAQADLEAAIDLARRQGARVFQLRSAVALAELLKGSDAARGRSALTDALTRFHTPPDLPETARAQALLAGAG